MEYLLIGFFTGLSLILALGAQNVFVIEQGLKRQYTFLVCLICSISDYLLIFLGIILFEYFQSYFNQTIELILNILLLLFLSLKTKWLFNSSLTEGYHIQKYGDPKLGF